MRQATIFYSNGDIIRTTVNGTNTEIQDYYKLGSVVNIGTVEDNLQTIEALTIENLVHESSSMEICWKCDKETDTKEMKNFCQHCLTHL